MSVAEVRSCSTSDPMKPEQEVLKLEKERCDSLDNTISQEIGREPFLSFSRTGESSAQWIQLLHALDQQGSSTFFNGTKVDNHIEGKERGLDHFNSLGPYPSDMNLVKESVHSLKSSGLPTNGTKNTSQQIQTLNIPEAVAAFVQAAAKANGEPEKYLPGWPLLSPSKVQLQKCDKCSREFCSTINYRRHKRVHRRPLNTDKDSPKNRGLLGAFWNKLSLDDGKEILSLKNAAIEGVTGSSVIRALTSLIRKPGLFSLPEVYVKAGMTLLDLIQARPSKLPISSHELFDVLDDASENTFLCAGTALSMQKFVFDGETEKIALEMKNLIACASFMLEQKLVKAWLTDKDIEALRCQKLLVEEEEAAQRRQAEILERKRLKKLRQKEQKEKESTDTNKAGSNVCSPETVEETSGSTGLLSPRSPSESDKNTTEVSFNEDLVCPDPPRASNSDMKADSREHMHSVDADENLDSPFHMGSDHRQPITVQWLPPNPTRNGQNVSHSGQVPAVKGSVLMKHGSYRDPKAVMPTNGHKVWTRKTKPENKEEGINDRDRVDREYRELETKVTKQQLDLSEKIEVLIGSINVRLGDDNGQQKLPKCGTSVDGVNRSAVKLWRPVGRRCNGDSATIPDDKSETKLDGSCGELATDCNLPDESHHPSGDVDDNFSTSCKDSSMVLRSADQTGPILFSRHFAEAFLAQRWKEALAADHVVLSLPPETEASDCLDNGEGNPGETPHHAQNPISVTSSSGPPSISASKPNFVKPEKSYRVMYVPKQRNNG